MHLSCIKTLCVIGLPIDVFESLAFHLRVLLKDFRIALAKHLGHPFVRDAAGAEPGGVRRAEIVNPKIRNLRALQSLVPDGVGSKYSCSALIELEQTAEAFMTMDAIWMW